MEPQTNHRKFTIASVAVAFIGIVALGVAGVSTFAGAGAVNEHPGCQAGETEYQHLEGSGSNADISWSFDGTTATVTALNDSPLIMQIAIKSGGGPTVDDGLFTYRPGGTASATEQSTSTAPGNPEEEQDVSFIDVCVGVPTGSLSVSKTVDGAGATGSETFDIEVDCTDDAFDALYEDIEDGFSDTITGIPVGVECTVTETATADADATTVNGSDGTSAGVTVDADGETVAFVNTFEAGGGGGGGLVVTDDETTTAEVGGVVVEPETPSVAPEVAPEELAFTGIGDSTALFAALGALLISFGIGLAWAGRRELALVHDDR